MNGHTFLDASLWIAYRDERQELHAEAKRIVLQVLRSRLRIITTLPVICEIQAHFSRNAKRKHLIVADFWNNPLVKLESTTHRDQSQAFEILNRQADKSYSLCDTLSFAVIRRLGLKQVLAFDDHFRQFGEFQINF